MKIHDDAGHGDLRAVLTELARGTPVDVRNEHDYTPLACAASSPAADASMIQLLAGAGADVNAVVENSKTCPLDLATCSGSLEKMESLVDAGADASFVSKGGYTILVNAIYKRLDDKRLVAMIELLTKRGADPNSESQYGESPLSVASRFGRFDAVKALLDAGSDPAPLQWTELMRATTLGSTDQISQLLSEKEIVLHARDRWERTPWLLACLANDVDKAKLLLDAGADLADRDRMGYSALAISAARGHVAMLSWLLSIGANIESVDDADHTVLMLAAQAGETECVRLLLQAGALPNRVNEHDECAMTMASSEGVMRLLMEHGGNVDEINTDLKRSLLGLQGDETLNATPNEYRSGSRPRFGTSNPEVMNVPFWHEMVRTGISAYQAKAQFNDETNLADATWCYSRFGVSFTELPDGRFVQIGGEHEDHYDPDFCIYNDVLVHDRNGRFQIMGYPERVFPPTDFHSATYRNGFIYIVGGLGYYGSRRFGTTPVYRLNCETWKIEPVTTTGSCPGWVYGHSARLQESSQLVISGGKMCVDINGKEEHHENETIFNLDLDRGIWARD